MQSYISRYLKFLLSFADSLTVQGVYHIYLQARRTIKKKSENIPKQHEKRLCEISIWLHREVVDIYKSIGIVEVMPPQGPELFLATNIPNCEHHILVLNFLHIETCVKKKKCKTLSKPVAYPRHHKIKETKSKCCFKKIELTDCGNSWENFSYVQLVEYRCFASRIQTQHNDLE